MGHSANKLANVSDVSKGLHTYITPVSAIPALTLRSPLICCFIAVFSDISFCLFMYFGLVFTILDRIRAKIIQNRQINVKMSTCNLTKIAKSVILETFLGLKTTNKVVKRIWTILKGPYSVLLTGVLPLYFNFQGSTKCWQMPFSPPKMCYFSLKSIRVLSVLTVHAVCTET